MPDLTPLLRPSPAAEERNAFDAAVTRLRSAGDDGTPLGLARAVTFQHGPSKECKTTAKRLLLDATDCDRISVMLEELQERRKQDGVAISHHHEEQESRGRVRLRGLSDALTRDPGPLEGSVARFEFADEDAEVLRDVLRQLADKMDGAGINGRCTLCGSNRHPGTGWIFDESTETSIPPADCENSACLSHSIREVLHGNAR